MTTTPTLHKPIFMRETKPVVLPPVFDNLEKANAQPTNDKALSTMRHSAYLALKKIGLPNTDSEDFTFIRIGDVLPHLGPPSDAPDGKSTLASKKSLAQVDKINQPNSDFIQSMIYAECRENYAVLVDGVFVPGLSHFGPGISIKPLGHEYRDQIEAAITEETDAAATLAILFSSEPVLVEIAPKCISNSPLQILQYRSLVNTALEPIVESKAGHRNDAFMVIHAGILSEAKILIRHVSSPGIGASPTLAVTANKPASDGMNNQHILLLLDEAASLQVMESGSGSGSGAGLESGSEGEREREDEARLLHFHKLTGRLQRNSRLVVVSAHTGSRLTRHSFSVDLLGEGADAEINGAVVLTGNRQAHNFVRIRHMVPHCTSRQRFKSVSADQTRSSVDGTIYVAKDAQGTNANQQINNLMLSDEARSNSKPQLMIFADDVKCSHGATVGKLDPAQQFYLISRGLSPVQARTLLTVAFIAEILEKAGPAGQKIGAMNSDFRSTLDHALLDSLKLKLPV